MVLCTVIFFLVEKIRSTPDPETDEKKKQALFSNIAAARGAPRHDQRSLSGVYDAYVLERYSSESEDTTTDILERCISQSEKSIWRCVKSSRESGDDENELWGAEYGPKGMFRTLFRGCFGNTPYPRARNSHGTEIVVKAN